MINNRCPNHLFGYCDTPQLQKPTVINNTDKTVNYKGIGKCPEKWQKCPHYRTLAQSLKESDAIAKP